jgi:TRAP-type transport system periplasmic protein
MVEVGESLVPFGLASAKADDQAIADIFLKKGAKIHDMTSETLEHWRGIATDSAWREYASRTQDSARLLKLAQEVKA